MLLKLLKKHKQIDNVEDRTLKSRDTQKTFKLISLQIKIYQI